MRIPLRIKVLAGSGAALSVIAFLVLRNFESPRARLVPVAASAKRASEPTPDEAADDAVAILRRYFPLGQAVGWLRWLRCPDEEVGYPEVLGCAARAADTARETRAKMPRVGAAKFACGREIEVAHRRLIVAAAKLCDDRVSYLLDNDSMLRVKLAGKSYHEAERLGMPDPEAKKYDDASYEVVKAIECTQTLFNCGTDMECSVGEVARRLGLDPSNECGSGPACALTVQASGRTINAD